MKQLYLKTIIFIPTIFATLRKLKHLFKATIFSVVKKPCPVIDGK